MPWARSDDTTLFHPKVIRLGRGGDDRTLNEAYGFIARCVTWSGSSLTDGFIFEEIAQAAAPTRWQVLIKAGISAGVLSKRARNEHGDRGWAVDMSDHLFHVRSKEEVLRDREASARQTRVQKVAREVRLRDGDQCRYCGKSVTFEFDRRSNRSGQYDHVIPPDEGGDDSAENIVVACGACNRRKAKGTLDAAGMVLLDPPTNPLYSPYTRKQFDLDQDDARNPEAAEGAQDDAADARPEAAEGAQDTAATDQHRSRTARPGSDLDLSANGGRPGSGSGRDGGGSGREGSGSPDPPPRTDQPRTRGSRGRRRRPQAQAGPDERSAP